jgi:hypothetical protein
MPTRGSFLRQALVAAFAAVPAARALIGAAPAFAVETCVDTVTSYVGYRCARCGCLNGYYYCDCGYDCYTTTDAHSGVWCWDTCYRVCGPQPDGGCCPV